MTEETARQGFRDLIAWQKSMDLVTAIYEATRPWPREEQFGLTSQIRRAAVSIPSCIAEGHGRTGPKELQHQVSIAFGSVCEVETQLLIAERLAYVDERASSQLSVRVTEVRKLLHGLLRSLRARSDRESGDGRVDRK